MRKNVITLYYKANKNTAYTVEHYLEKLDGSYELKDTENLTGTTDSEVRNRSSKRLSWIYI